MTQIYIKHSNGHIMEVQNWATLTDYGVMITRQLDEDERKRYLALKAVRLNDSEIWRLFHPAPSTDECNPALTTSPTTTRWRVQEKNTIGKSTSDLTRSPSLRPFSPSSGESVGYRRSHTAPPNSPSGSDSQDRQLVELSIHDLSRGALLRLVQHLPDHNLATLNDASREELLTLASASLPKDGVNVALLP